MSDFHLKPYQSLATGSSDSAYVFHAPDFSIATSRLSAIATSVRYTLSRMSDPFRLDRSASHPRTVSTCLCGTFRGAPRSGFHNHQLVCPAGMWLWSLSLQPLRSQVRVGELGTDFSLTGRDRGSPFFDHNARSEQRPWVQR